VKYFLIVGEASGDLHASNLIKELKAGDAEAVFQFWGGNLMEKHGGTLLKHYRELAFMGFWEVLVNIFTILRNFKQCKRDILTFNPDVVILVDYPGFNLRMARFASKHYLKVFYYISPQVWAWKESRVHQIKKTVDKMFVILPFEKEFYNRYNYNVDFVGHPLLDAIADGEVRETSQEKPIIAIVPGSRTQEISRMLPVMVSIKDQYPNHRFVIAGVSSVSSDIYQQFLSEQDEISVEYDNFDSVLNRAEAALITSGTATLQAALLKVPLVVCYKGSFFSYFIAKRLINTEFISLVNLIMGKEIVAELIQGQFNKMSLKQELDKLLQEGPKQEMLNEFNSLRYKLGGPGASAKAAGLMLGYLK